MAYANRDELANYLAMLDPRMGEQYLRENYGTLDAVRSLPGVRMSETWTPIAEGGQEFGGTQVDFGGGDGYSYYGGFDPQGNLMGYGYAQQPERSWYDAIGPALPIGAALGAAALGGAAAGGAGAGATGAGAGGGAGLFGAGELGSGLASLSGVTGSIPALTEGGAALAGGGALPALGGAGAAAAGAAAGAVPAGFTLDAMGKLIPLATGALSGISAANAPNSQTATSEMPERVLPYANDLLSRAQAQSNQPYTPYGGPNPYQVTQDQRDAIGATRTAMDQFGEASAGARNVLNQIQTGQRDITPGTVQNASNPYIGQGIAAPSNSYIGATTQGVRAPGSVLGLAQQAQASNPYIDRTSGQASVTSANQAGRNALLGLNNPYLNSAIDHAMGDVSRQYSLTTAPQRSAQAVGSGSFGNTGVQQMAQEDQRQLAQELGRVSTGMRMQDYALQAGLGEGQAGREQGVNLFNAGAANQGSQFNVGINAQDLARQTGATNQLGLANANNLLNAGMFDVTSGQRAQEFNSGLAQGDLSRNAQLQQQQGQFGASLGQADLARNAQLAGQLSQFNSGVSAQNVANAMGAANMNNQTALGSINPTLNIANNPIQQAQTLFNMGQSTGQTGANSGLFDYQQYLQQQQYPWQQLSNYGNAITTGAGRGGTVTQPLATPNVWGNVLGGAALGGQLYNLWGRG